jgi:hypothetical protein
MSELHLREIAFRLIAMGEQADALCRQNTTHRCAARLRDPASQIEHGAKALSKSALEAIAGTELSSRNKREKTTPRTAKPKPEADDAGVFRFVNLGFRRAVEKTGKVVAVGMERRR